MDELIGFLLGATVVLTVVAVVGHVIWVVAATLLKAIFQNTEPRIEDERTRVVDDENAQELYAALRQVTKLWQQGRLSITEHRRLRALFIEALKQIESQQADAAEAARAVAPVPAVADVPPLAKAVSEVFASKTAPTDTTHEESLLAAAAEIPLTVEPEEKPTEVLTFFDDEEDETEKSATPELRGLAHVLQGFMEEKNIRWGELVSGMLIIGSATGLVVSLWATLRDSIPYLPALIFLLVTGAIHFAGRYTLSRWKLGSTSRGLLVISALLVPLSFLAAIAISEGESRSISDPLYVAAIIIGALAFGSISASTGWVMMRGRWWPLVVAQLGPSLGQLLIARLAHPGMSTTETLRLMSVPFAAHAIALGAWVWLASRGAHMTRRRIVETLLLTGVAWFSLAMPVGLLVWETQSPAETLGHLAPWISTAGAMLCAVGLVIDRRTVGERLIARSRDKADSLSTADQAVARSLAALRTTGTALALLGTVVMLGAIGLAWPDPPLLIAVGCANLILLVALGMISRLPHLHTAGALSGALAGLVAFHWFANTLGIRAGISQSELVAVLLMGRSALVLSAGALLAGLVGWFCTVRQHRPAAVGYLWGAAAIGLISAAIACYAGFSPVGLDPSLSVIVLGTHAALALAAASRVRIRAFTYLSSALLFVACLQATHFNPWIAERLAQIGWTLDRPILTALLAHASIIALLGLSTRQRSERIASLDAESGSVPTRSRTTHVTQPLLYSALATSTTAIAPLLWIPSARFDAAAGRWFWESTILFAISIGLKWRPLRAMAQWVATCAVCLAVTAVCQRQPWWAGEFLDPRHMLAQFGMLAVWSLAWIALRRCTPWNADFRSLPTLQDWFSDVKLPSSDPAKRETAFTWPAMDRAILAIVVFAMSIYLGIAALPGFGMETHGATYLVPVSMPSIGMVLAICVLVMGLALALIAASRAWASLWALAALPFVIAALTAPQFGLTQFAERLAAMIPHHEAAFTASGWIAFALVLTATLLAFRERATVGMATTVWLATLLAPQLIGGAFEVDLATVSALRWSFALHAAITGLLIANRAALSRAGQRFGFLNRPEFAGDPFVPIRHLTVALCVFPVFAKTVAVVLASALGRPPAGPAAGTLFDDLSPALSYAGPLWLLAVAAIVIALSQRMPAFALAGSLLIGLGAAIAYAFPLWLTPTVLDGAALIEFMQVVGLVFAVYWIVWLIVSWKQPDRLPEPSGVDAPASFARGLRSPLAWQTLLSTAFATIPLVWGLFALIVEGSPRDVADVIPVGSGWGFLLWTLVMGAIAWQSRSRWPRAAAESAATFACGLVVLIASALVVHDAAEPWLAFHALMAGSGFLLAAGTSLVWLTTLYESRGPLWTDPDQTSAGWLVPISRTTYVVGGALILMALRAEISDPARPWWSAGSAGLVAFSAAVFSFRWRKEAWGFVSTALGLLAVTLLWLHPFLGIGISATPQSVIELIQANLVALTIAGLVWLGAELYCQRRFGVPFDAKARSPYVPHFAAITAQFVISIFALLSIGQQLTLDMLRPPAVVEFASLGTWIAVATLAVLIVGSAWDSRARFVISSLYFLGLAALVFALDSINLPSRLVPLGIGLAVAGYVLLTGHLWRARLPIAAAAQSLRIQQTAEDARHFAGMLPVANLCLTAIAIAATTWIVLTQPVESQRVLSATSVLGCAVGLLLLASGPWRSRLQFIGLLVAAIAAVEGGWAIMAINPDNAYWLKRAVRAMVMLAATTFLYGVPLVRLVPRGGFWHASIRKAAVTLGAASINALVVVLILEGVWFDSRAGAPVSDWEIGIVAAVLVGLASALVSIAVLPGRDPLELTDKERTLYVYAAEGLFALLFLHVYLTRPDFFGAYFRPYWPLVVMAIAFLGSGASEMFRRLKLPVLAEPLERTGALLPLVPALGFWVASSNSNYSEVLFLAGLVYVILALLRGNVWYGLLAAIAGNAGLWALFHEHHIEFLSRPQAWLIPPALSALVAAQWNRKRLTRTQLTAIRYLCSIVIYTSSAGEMFLRGVGESLMLPMVLMALSVAGVLTGILLRVRAFLYLGTSFLMLSIVSMVWHAAQNIGHVWPWWAFGVVLGLSVLALFGVFEKKRADMLGLVHGLRQWEQ